MEKTLCGGKRGSREHSEEATAVTWPEIVVCWTEGGSHGDKGEETDGGYILKGKPKNVQMK